MKVPFVMDDNREVCILEMTSQPALDMSFEHKGKHYKVTHVIEECNADKQVTGYVCTVKSISKRSFDQN